MNRIIVYRISYIENGQTPSVEIIYDNIIDTEDEYIDIADYG
jgi:hypothetical protein